VGLSLQRSIEHSFSSHGYRPGGLALILLQNLVLSTPLLLLGALLTWTGRALT
jgi:hypothetical protein